VNAQAATWLVAGAVLAACSAGRPHVARASAAAAEATPPVGPPSADAAPAPSHPELDRIARRAGTWDVTMTMRPTPDAEPVVVRGLVAERAIIGPYLQEIMKPGPGSEAADFRRIDYLTYNPLQRRWQYLSMDTRATIGLMYAASAGRDDGSELTLFFIDAPAPTELGPAVSGRFMRARHVLTRQSGDRELVRQYWTVGGSPEWLAVQYEYTRR
jgi:hypothetical protein